MYIEIEPETHIDFIDNVGKPADIHQAALAMFNSAVYLQEFGAKVTPTEVDKAVARDVLLEVNEMSDVDTAGKAVHLLSLLNEYDRAVVESYAQVRTYVLNRLIEEAQPGNKGAIRALELLGKVSGVDLFMERKEITVNTQSTSDLKTMVREKLIKLKNMEAVVDIPMRQLPDDKREIKDEVLKKSKELLNAI